MVTPHGVKEYNVIMSADTVVTLAIDFDKQQVLLSPFL